MERDAISAFVDEVERYLAVHPEAADTAEGILRWWLPATFADLGADEMQRALARLVERGSVVRQRMADGQTVYSRGTRNALGTPNLRGETPWQ